ncbi:hypothetical protein M409DRAFT_23689 [Zasmidium cellare ATCC 36951]|uniref:Amidohydrolase-related domain-containing protein n=1 Tax=Zasmidium cellare ATCC 36951 TaxID=1080233 RepID=A0A6A6CFX5_ZASCE|nr:uncharacterized protein M409DRAFT_23689 [Zasmidium cellare ATCC 36951]KAF2165961.1 hypothetical protein M409DRAFT_23689 [Zasmidium cellare ATCC 36951]
MSFVISDVQIFDGEAVVTKNGAVLVEDGLIKAIGEDLAARYPHLETISKPGHTLLPGLIDAHCHPYGESSLPEQAFRFGITTIMDLQNEHHQAVRQKQWAKERKDFPDVKSSHHAATIAGGWPEWFERRYNNNPEAKWDNWPNVANIDDAEPFIERAVRDGADYIKLFHEGGAATDIQGLVQPREEVQAAVVAAARRQSLKVIAHALARQDTIEVLRAGVDGMAHSFYDKPINPEIIAAYKTNNAWLNPTLAAVGSLTGEANDLLKSFSTDPRVVSRTTLHDMSLLSRCMHMSCKGAKWEYAIDSVRQLKAAGFDIICGSDAARGAPSVVFGATFHLELHLLVEKAGLLPVEALRAATGVTAKRFGWNDRGRIQPGLKADLLLVEGDPVTDITELLNIREIWRDGVRFEGHPGFAK